MDVFADDTKLFNSIGGSDDIACMRNDLLVMSLAYIYHSIFCLSVPNIVRALCHLFYCNLPLRYFIGQCIIYSIFFLSIVAVIHHAHSSSILRYCIVHLPSAIRTI